MDNKKDFVLNKIDELSPWYQCITFEDYNITTTDKPENVFPDNAYDNLINDISIEEATKLRPIPKWNEISKVINKDAIYGKSVLEIGSNCGFFSFKFADLGATNVVGLDVSPHHLKCEEFCKEFFAHKNIDFYICDFFLYNKNINPTSNGLLANNNLQIELPNNQFDIVFSSTVIDHSFFPALFIYKCLKIAKERVYLDIVPCENLHTNNHNTIRIGLSDDMVKYPHHGYSFSISAIVGIIKRFGIKKDDIQLHYYNDNKNCLLCIDTTNMAMQLNGA